jgi:N-acyl-D-aspartate/D-glutamate deacylase
VEWRSWSRYVGALDEQRALREQVQAQQEHLVGLQEQAAREADRARELSEEGERLRAALDAAVDAGRAGDEDRAALRDAHAGADRERREALDALAAERARIEQFRGTRRYRAAGLLAAPLDRLRRHGR